MIINFNFFIMQKRLMTKVHAKHIKLIKSLMTSVSMISALFQNYKKQNAVAKKLI